MSTWDGRDGIEPKGPLEVFRNYNTNIVDVHAFLVDACQKSYEHLGVTCEGVGVCVCVCVCVRAYLYARDEIHVEECIMPWLQRLCVLCVCDVCLCACFGLRYRPLLKLVLRACL